jgi:hypothetical protein
MGQGSTPSADASRADDAAGVDAADRADAGADVGDGATGDVGAADALADRDAGPPHITPGAATVSVTRRLQLSADQPVTWSVQEGPSGGTVDASGLYQAPASIGTFHVVATNANAETASATLTVVPLTLDLVAGMLVGAGNVDGVGQRAYFDHPAVIAAAGETLYVVEGGDTSAIRVVDAQTGAVTTPCGKPGDARVVDGPVSTARFGSVEAIATTTLTGPIVADSYALRLLDFPAPTTIATVAGVPNSPGFVDGPAANAHFGHINGLASGKGAVVYVSDYSNNAIRVVHLDTMMVSTLAGGGPNAAGFVDGTGTDARFRQVQGIVYDGDSTLYVADYTSGIRTVNVNTGETATIYSQPAYVGYGVALDGAGHLLFSDDYVAIRQLDLATGDVTVFAGGTLGTQDGVGAAASFGFPYGIAADGQGSLFVADVGSDAIRKIDLATARVTTVAGAVNCTVPACSHGGDPWHSPASVVFETPSTLLATDATVYDSNDNPTNGASLRRIDLLSNVQKTVTPLPYDNFGIALLGGGKAVLGGSAVFTELDLVSNAMRPVTVSDASSAMWPGQLADDGSGGVFLVTGQYQTLAHLALSDPGVPDAGLTGVYSTVLSGFSYPQGVARAADGIVFVADANAIYQVGPGAQTPSLLAGAPQEAGFADGTGASARFNQPAGLALDGYGSLFVADRLNGLVRKVDLGTAAVTTVVGLPNLRGVHTGALPTTLNAPRQLAVAGNGDLAIMDEDAVLWLH